MSSLKAGRVILITSPSRLGQETAKRHFGLRVKLPPAYRTRLRLHIGPFGAKRSAEEL